MSDIAPEDIDPAYSVLNGKITALYLTEGRSSVYEGMRAKLAECDFDPLRIDLLGNEAWETMRGMHTSGEHGEQCFGCLIGDDLIVGYANVLGLVEGDDVLVVAEKMEHRAYLAAAIYRYRDGLVWMHTSSKGFGAELLFVAKIWCAQAALLLGALWLAGGADELPMMFAADVAITLLVALPYLGTSFKSAEATESVLKRLGFRNTYWINLGPYMGSDNTFNLEKTLAATQRCVS